MRTWVRSIIACGALALMATTFTSPAVASCSADAGMGRATFLPALYTPENELGRLVRTDGSLPAITGLWKFTFTAKNNGSSGPPDGMQIDAGYVT